MHKQIRLRKPHASNRRGAMMVLVAFMMVAFMLTVVFSIDVAHMHLTRTELRTASDAAAKAAAQELASTRDTEKAIAKAKEIAKENRVAGTGLVLANSDIDFGRSTPNRSGRFVFDTKGEPFNSVVVRGNRKRGSASGSVDLLFGNFFGVPDFQPEQEVSATFVERDIALVVDRSGSMNGGGKKNGLKQAIKAFIDTLEQTPSLESVGLASYSTRSRKDLALTTNISSITSTVNGMRFSGRTNVTGGIDHGREILLAASEKSRVSERTIIVMTDGIYNEGGDPKLAADRAFANDITVHTITFGNGANKQDMKRTATAGGGRHFHASTNEELIKVYKEIALTLTTTLTQ